MVKLSAERYFKRIDELAVKRKRIRQMDVLGLSEDSRTEIASASAASKEVKTASEKADAIIARSDNAFSGLASKDKKLLETIAFVHVPEDLDVTRVLKMHKRLGAPDVDSYHLKNLGIMLEMDEHYPKQANEALKITRFVLSKVKGKSGVWQKQNLRAAPFVAFCLELCGTANVAKELRECNSPEELVRTVRQKIARRALELVKNAHKAFLKELAKPVEKKQLDSLVNLTNILQLTGSPKKSEKKTHVKLSNLLVKYGDAARKARRTLNNLIKKISPALPESSLRKTVNDLAAVAMVHHNLPDITVSLHNSMRFETSLEPVTKVVYCALLNHALGDEKLVRSVLQEAHPPRQ